MTDTSSWTIPDDDRAALDGVATPPELAFDPAAKDISYPHCKESPTNRQCILSGGLDVGVIWMTHCIDANGKVTKTYDCRPQ